MTALTLSKPAEDPATPPESPHRPSLLRAQQLFIVAGFLVSLWVPLIGMQGTPINHGRGWDLAAARAENRNLAQRPGLLSHVRGLIHRSSGSTDARIAKSTPQLGRKQHLKALLKFPGDFKYFFSDHFGFRSTLIRWHGLLKVRGLGVTSNPSVVLGKDGWLFLAGEKSLEDYRNLEPFTSAELEQWRQMLQSRNDWCIEHGIPYLFVVAPSKYDIYPEYMPDVYTRLRPDSRLDQLLAYLKEKESTVPILDLRPVLLNAKSQGRLFQKTDTHWNDRGAWLAYQAIMKAVQERVPSASALPLSRFEPITVMRPGMDLAGLLGLNDLYQEESFDLKPRIPLALPKVTQNDVTPITVERESSDPRIVMFRDSFMTIVLPFVAESFSRGTYLWEDGFNPELIEAETPDIVVQEMAERKLMQPVELLKKTKKLRYIDGKWIQ